MYMLQGISLRVREEKCTRRPGRCSYTLVQVLKGNKVRGRYSLSNLLPAAHIEVQRACLATGNLVRPGPIKLMYIRARQ